MHEMWQPLLHCALNVEVSRPADCNTYMIHLAIVLGDTGLYGLMKDKNNLETKRPLPNLSASVREIYSLNAASRQIKAQSEDENVISVHFPGLVVFNRTVTTKLIESRDSFLKFRFKAAYVWCLCAEANANSMTALRVNNFKLSSCKGAKV